MPFEPLRTDEPHLGPKAKRQDLDSQMLAGCGTFVFVSLMIYFVSIWPHFAFQETYRLKTLAMNCAFGMVPAAILGTYATRRFGLAAAGGFAGGALSMGIFLFLRLQQVLAVEGNMDFPQPEFPQSWQYLIPGAWILAVMILAALFLKKEEISLD